MAVPTRKVVCPACNAQVDKPCSRPSDTGRVSVNYHHYSRVYEANKAKPQEITKD